MRGTLALAVLLAAAAHEACGVSPGPRAATRRSVLATLPFVPAALAAQPRVSRATERTGLALNVLITGANSGIGFAAASKLVGEGHSVTLACRTQARADAAAAAINAEAGAERGVARGVECDLASLASVRRCAAELLKSGVLLDVLCLNAAVAPGTQETAPKRTVEQFEETIGVNHLGHFLLANSLLPVLKAQPGRPAPRIVVTASEVHNPEEPGGQVGSKASLGDLSGLRTALSGGEWSMVDGGVFDPDKAYKDSKLCNMLFLSELERRLEASGSKVRVNAFSPGLITRTGLFRSQRPLFTAAFDFLANNVAKFAETVEYGGGCIDFMAMSPELEGQGGLFYSDYPPGKHTLVLRTPSAEARDACKAAELWALSEKLVGLGA
ncbi:hypothetical protein T492DRAFT_940258 [Pavlovales sp. CCMP2436]|nr:hypothetical protein T492DRAFT_940258 [Pavlovales sp. CCMP2436]